MPKQLIRRLIGVMAIGLALLSLMFLVMAMGDLLGGTAMQSPDGPATDPSVLWGLLIFFLGLTLSTGWLARWGFGSTNTPEQPELNQDQQLRRVLQAAQASQGSLTLLELAAVTPFSLAQCETLLETLITQRLAQMQIREDGVVLYVFPDFLPGSTSDN